MPGGGGGHPICSVSVLIAQTRREFGLHSWLFFNAAMGSLVCLTVVLAVDVHPKFFASCLSLLFLWEACLVSASLLCLVCLVFADRGGFVLESILQFLSSKLW